MNSKRERETLLRFKHRLRRISSRSKDSDRDSTYLNAKIRHSEEIHQSISEFIKVYKTSIISRTG